MKTLSYFLTTIIVFITSCNTTDDTITIPPADASNFNLLWETQVSPVLPDNLPQGILIDELGRNYLYVSEKAGGVTVYEKTTGNKITNISISEFGGHHAMHLSQQGNYLYIALGSFFGGNSKAGMAVIDVTDPTLPSVTDFWESTSVIKGSAIAIADGNHVYLGAMNQGIYVFDVTNKANIIETDHYIPDPDFPIENPNSIQEPNARGMDIKGTELFVCYDAGGIRVIDVTDKSNIFEKSRYINDSFNKQKAYNNIIINGNYAYTAVDYCGMEVLDISDSSNIVRTSWCNPWNCETSQNTWFNSGGHTNQLELDTINNRMLLSSGGSEITILDVSDPNNCTYVTSYGNRDNNKAVWGLDFENDKVYATYITTQGIPFTGDWSGIKCVEVLN